MVPLIQSPASLFISRRRWLALLCSCWSCSGGSAAARRRAERSAAEVRSQLQTVTATMREGVIAYDMDRRLKFVNPAFERLTGYPEEDLRDQEFLQYIHPEDRPAILAEWDRLAQGGALRDQEYRVVTRTGQIRWCSSSWEPMRDETGRQIGYLGTEFDITERKLAEEEMRLDTELFQAVLEVEQAVVGGRTRLRDGHASHRRAEPGAYRGQRRGDRGDRGRGSGSPGARSEPRRPG